MSRDQARQDQGSQGGQGSSRFPGFSAVAQARHWDPVTAGVVLSRLGRPPDLRFFTPSQEAVVTALRETLDTIELAWQRIEFGRARSPSPKSVLDSRP